jgi:hypothetical protein
MSTTSIIMMIIVVGSYFSGFAYLLYKASRAQQQD